MRHAGLLTVAVAGALLALATPAAAQLPMPGLDLHPDTTVAPEVQEKRDEIDRAYRNTKGSLPAQQQSGAVDPWANMRSADEAKPAAKPKAAAKPAAKPATASAQKKPAAAQ
jgi:hypothetical protein